MALVHKFKQGEEYIVLDVNSGAVHAVDELVYDIIEDEGLEEIEIPAELKDMCETRHTNLIEAVAEFDERE